MSRYCLARYAGPLGELLLASEGAALVGAWFEGQRHYASGCNLQQAAWADVPPLSAARSWLDAYFAGQQPEQPLPLAPKGTPFRQAVWQQLQRIPYGATTTYGEIAAALRARGMRASAQAVGGAVGRNPLSLFIPCHRVLGAGGALTGYAAGVEKKQWLLRHESLPAVLPCFPAQKSVSSSSENALQI